MAVQRGEERREKRGERGESSGRRKRERERENAEVKLPFYVQDEKKRSMEEEFMYKQNIKYQSIYICVCVCVCVCAAVCQLYKKVEGEK